MNYADHFKPRKPPIWVGIIALLVWVVLWMAGLFAADVCVARYDWSVSTIVLYGAALYGLCELARHTVVAIWKRAQQ